jgi:hypothetical protein
MPAQAATKNWIDGSDNWYVDANWSPAGQPETGDDVNIVFSDDVARTVAYSYDGPSVALGALKIDMTGPGTNEVALTTVGLLTTTSEEIGVDGRGRLEQTVGNHTTNGLTLGANSGASGTYNLSISGALTLTGSTTIGLNGTGDFNQSGGTVNVTALATPLYLGRHVGAVGNYTLTGGTLTAPSQIVGSNGTGTFTHSAGANNANTVNISEGLESSAAYLLSGTGKLTTDTLNVGIGGSASFTQSGGASNSNLVQIATTADSDGKLWVSGGVANAGNIYVGGTATGAGGIGILDVTGSNTVLNVTGGINVYQSVSNAFNFSGGTINTPAINVNGLPLRFNWTGGTLNITNDATWGGGSATSTSAIFGSSLSLSQNKILRVTGNETIGGDGVFNLNVASGGTHSVTGTITLKAGGTLSASTSSVLSYANFIQAGGTINNTFRNLTNFVYQSGSFSGTFINDGTASFNAPLIVTNLTNNGSMTVAAGQTFSVTSTSTNTGNVTVNGGTFSGSSQFTNTGSMVVNGGTFTGFGQFINSGNFALNGSTVSSLSSFTNAAAGTLTARGTISVDLTNQGTTIVDGSLALTKSFTNTGTLQGAGTISNTGAMLNNNAGGVVNATTPGGTLAITNQFSSAPGALINIGSTSTFAPSPQGWTNSGVVNLLGAGARLAGGTIMNNGVVQGFGTVAATLATANTGVYRASGGDLAFTNSFLNSAQTTVQVMADSSITFLQGMTSNSGLVSIDGGMFDNTSKPLVNQGTINGHGTLRTGGLTNNSGRLVSIGGGDMDVFGTVTNNGVISIQNGRTAYFWNNVSGSGSFTGTGTAVFLASLAPGSSPASVSFAGGVNLGGATSLAMELGGTAAGTQYDQIHVAGQLALGGGLSVSLISGFTPAAGDSFDLLDWGSIAGTFSSLSLPTLGSGLEWDTSQLYSAGVVSVNLSGVPGDYNGDGAVNAADFVQWRKGGPLANESVTPGTVDASDYDAWRARFGNLSGSGAGSGSSAVPEPAAVLVLMTAAMTMGLSRLRCRER